MTTTSALNRVKIINSQEGAQAYGSALTYARRYGITLLLCVCADDGPARSRHMAVSSKTRIGISFSKPYTSLSVRLVLTREVRRRTANSTQEYH